MREDAISIAIGAALGTALALLLWGADLLMRSSLGISWMAGGYA